MPVIAKKTCGTCGEEMVHFTQLLPADDYYVVYSDPEEPDRWDPLSFWALTNFGSVIPVQVMGDGEPVDVRTFQNFNRISRKPLTH